MRPFPIGYDNFGQIRQRNLKFIDKTGFIVELFRREGVQVTLITRPRRFGKTLALSMLHHFLAQRIMDVETAPLFNGLRVTASPEIMMHQGKYPVIFVSFKDIKPTSFQDCLERFSVCMASLYENHRYLLTSDALTDLDKQYFSEIVVGMFTASSVLNASQLSNALVNLCKYLYQHHKMQPWLLIDEYDSPIQSAYLNRFYDEAIPFIRDLLSRALKTNDALNRAVLTGITRVAKESMFSGLNNLGVYTLFDSGYSDACGFTEPELAALLKEYHLEDKVDDIRKWYNGYECGKTTLYNPWSIINFFSEGALQPYWVNTGGTDLIREILAQAGVEVKLDLEKILQREPIQAEVSAYLTFADLASDAYWVWSLLLSAGYLKATHRELSPQTGRWLCTLEPPNLEVFYVYIQCVIEWFERPNSLEYNPMVKALIAGDVIRFEILLQELLTNSMGFFDVSGTQPEKFYHGLVLGFLVKSTSTYIVSSNRESGYGYYDVMLVPKNPKELGIILEFKVASREQDIESALKTALKQIEEKGYETELKKQGVEKILKVAAVFCKKQVRVGVTDSPL
ncbi:MAG: hypothetical protein A3J38_05980 [Gammaproteobacteria bacterium RIFCSPHIGHO2_12_FULL_45_9]|nr:MAG: hypothetical protein A3J38_05980 [Gammaproteobacteria bacterium RIFCSPHIGHO2_12_FULL_45_9]